MADRLKDNRLANQLADDCRKHIDQEIYIKYLRQLTTANIKKEGKLSTQNNNLSSQIIYLKSLLIQNNIPFHLEPENNG